MLGRWAITYNYMIQNTKIDNANVDHCGCCEIKYADIIDSSSTTKTNPSANTNTNDNELVPYCM
jgi:hypothetical protein